MADRAARHDNDCEMREEDRLAIGTLRLRLRHLGHDMMAKGSEPELIGAVMEAAEVLDRVIPPLHLPLGARATR